MVFFDLNAGVPVQVCIRTVQTPLLLLNDPIEIRDRRHGPDERVPHERGRRIEEHVRGRRLTGSSVSVVESPLEQHREVAPVLPDDLCAMVRLEIEIENKPMLALKLFINRS